MDANNCLAAFTAPGSEYPSYINITRDGDDVIVTVRAEPTQINGSFICGYAPRDKGQPGRCTPGDEHCNNYCNRAPEKGLKNDPAGMAAAPREHSYKKEGPTVSMRMPIEIFRLLIADARSSI